VDRAAARQRVARARVGRLCTVTADHRPHVVPCCFVLHAGTAYSAIDRKPKSTLVLRRLQNLWTNAAASLLVDHYAEDWSELWWVRLDGSGRTVESEDERARALEMLARKYRQYREAPPLGAVIALDVERWRSWP